jgi:hypothetical protein
VFAHHPKTVPRPSSALSFGLLPHVAATDNKFLKLYLADGTYRMLQTAKYDTCDAIVTRVVNKMKPAANASAATTKGDYALFVHLKGGGKGPLFKPTGTKRQLPALLARAYRC